MNGKELPRTASQVRMKSRFFVPYSDSLVSPNIGVSEKRLCASSHTQKTFFIVHRKWLKAFLLTFLMITLQQCTPQKEDKLLFDNQSGGQKGALVSGWQDGVFREYKTFRANKENTITIGEFTSPKAKPDSKDHVIAYVTHRAPTRVPTRWSDGPDELKVSFEAEYKIPVYVWIVVGPFEEQEKRALDANERASRIWARERQGIRFETFEIADATNTSITGDDQLPITASRYFKSHTFDCSSHMPKLKSAKIFKPNSINVYYLGRVTAEGGGIGLKTGGFTCWLDPTYTIIALGHNVTVDLLVHELGHAFNLADLDDVPLFDSANVMYGASYKRNYLTEGQTFRAIFNPDSAINTFYQLRTGKFILPKVCASQPVPETEAELSYICPPIAKRIWSDKGDRRDNWPPN